MSIFNSTIFLFLGRFLFAAMGLPTTKSYHGGNMIFIVTPNYKKKFKLYSKFLFRKILQYLINIRISTTGGKKLNK